MWAAGERIWLQMKRPQKANLIFVTGTDTGVGKTLFTGLLLCHLRSKGIQAWAMKPFSSGGREDARIFRALQEQETSLEEINPFHFRAPLAPLVAARREKRSVALPEVLAAIWRLSRRCEVLLVEGAGGLMVPLGAGFTVRDLIGRLGCKVVVVARNRLGVINHATLTVNALQTAGLKKIVVALMEDDEQDLSSVSNAKVMSELLAPVGVLSVPFLGKRALEWGSIKNNSENLKKTLARFR